MDDRQFRNAMGKFATGVTVVTTEVDGEVHGMTANAFMSVSLNPKLVVVAVNEKAQILEKINKSKKYAVNILAADQEELSMIFAGQIKDRSDVKFDTLNGQPVLKGAIAQVTCELGNVHIEGDHSLVIGKVTDIHLEDEEPLLYFSGKYRSFSEE